MNAKKMKRMQKFNQRRQKRGGDQWFDLAEDFSEDDRRQAEFEYHQTEALFWATYDDEFEYQFCVIGLKDMGDLL